MFELHKHTLKVVVPKDFELVEGQLLALDSEGRVRLAQEGDTVIGTVAPRICKHCQTIRASHTESGKCLFEATSFEVEPRDTIEVQSLPQYMGPYILRNGVPTVDVGEGDVGILKGATVTITEGGETADLDPDNIGLTRYWRTETKGEP